MMLEAMKHELTIPYEVDWQVFKNWDKYLNWLYKTRMSSVKKWQMFGSSAKVGLAKMCFKRSNVEEAETAEEGLGKRNVTGEQQKSILLEDLTPLYAMKPGLREIKQVELWSKYRPLVPKEYRDECCPMPCKEVIEREKNKKKAKGKLKRDEKKEKQNLTVAARMPIVMATTASTTTASSGDQQTLTIHDTPLSPSKRSHEEAGLGNSG